MHTFVDFNDEYGQYSVRLFTIARNVLNQLEAKVFSRANSCFLIAY